MICTEWHAFRNPNFEKLKDALKGNVIFDGRNIYSPKEMTALGFDYYSIGR
ncbi:MAG: UDP binding domain-containing protein [Flavobacteriaceae bacterium]